MHNQMRTLVLVATTVAALATPAAAQYDRDGRYVPSPNGIPTDPYARPVPLYPGTPGGAIGTPSLPRNDFPPTSPPPVIGSPNAPKAPYAGDGLPRALRVPYTPAQCRRGWSAATGMSRREFDRRCDEILDR